MSVAMQRNRRPARRDERPQKSHELRVAIQRTDLSRMPVRPRNAGSLVADRKRYRRQTHRDPIPYVVIHALELLGNGEVTGVVVSNRDLHCAHVQSRYAARPRAASVLL